MTMKIEEMTILKALDIVLELAERGGYIEAKDATESEDLQEAFAAQQAAILQVLMLRDQLAAVQMASKPASKSIFTQHPDTPAETE